MTLSSMNRAPEIFDGGFVNSKSAFKNLVPSLIFIARALFSPISCEISENEKDFSDTFTTVPEMPFSESLAVIPFLNFEACSIGRKAD